MNVRYVKLIKIYKNIIEVKFTSFFNVSDFVIPKDILLSFAVTLGKPQSDSLKSRACTV